MKAKVYEWNTDFREDDQVLSHDIGPIYVETNLKEGSINVYKECQLTWLGTLSDNAPTVGKYTELIIELARQAQELASRRTLLKDVE